MKIELRKIQVNNRLSEETLCFSADIVIDGKVAGEATNRGHGGCTDYRLGAQGVHDRALEERAKVAARAWIEEHGSDEDRELLTPGPSTYQVNPLEHLIDLLVERHEEAKEAKKMAKIEAKNAAAFAATGKPWMVRIQTHGVRVWVGLADNAAPTIEKVLAHATKKYGSITQHEVLATKAVL